MSFYTGKGDQGYTDLLGDRVLKYEPRPETNGTIDEATSQIGFARSLAKSERTQSILLDVQRDLYLMMAELAFTSEVQQDRYRVEAGHLERIEEWTDTVANELNLPPEFILPGDSTAGAALDVARTVIRRAERMVVKLIHEGDVQNAMILAYLNRLSSLLFVLARDEDREAGASWTRAKS